MKKIICLILVLITTFSVISYAEDVRGHPLKEADSNTVTVRGRRYILTGEQSERELDENSKGNGISVKLNGVSDQVSSIDYEIYFNNEKVVKYNSRAIKEYNISKTDIYNKMVLLEVEDITITIKAKIYVNGNIIDTNSVSFYFTISDYGRGGTIHEGKIVYLDVISNANRDTKSITAMVYTRDTNAEGEEYIKYHLLNNFNSDIIDGYEGYYYRYTEEVILDEELLYTEDSIYRIRIYDCNWMFKEDKEEVTEWYISLKPEEENRIDEEIYTNETYTNVSEFLWTGIFGLTEEAPVELYEGNTYALVDEEEMSVEIFNDDYHSYNNFER